jgi:pyrroloquinoline quinone biosynthesis protein B
MPVASVFLTNADLDHTLGVFQLREGRQLTLTAPAPVRQSLERGLGLSHVVGAYAGLSWLAAPEEWRQVDDSGLEVRAVPLGLTGPPRYDVSSAGGSHAVGYVFRNGGGSAGIFPDVAFLDAALLAELEACERVWFDGTFWDEDELVRLGFSDRRAADMGHVPISGGNGSLTALSAFGPNRAAYLHINNTNPILRPDSSERAELEKANLRVAEDGEHFVI